MGLNVPAYILSKKYVAATAESLGSLKGAAATIKEIKPLENGDQEVIFQWEGTAGTIETTAMVIPKGEQGEAGEDGVSPSATVTKTGNETTITITDVAGTTSATIEDGEKPTVQDAIYTGDTAPNHNEYSMWIDTSDDSASVEDGIDDLFKNGFMSGSGNAGDAIDTLF